MFTILNRIIWLNALVLFIILSPNPSKADMASEIDHLIAYIESADCTFIRNEKVHDNQDASDHIQKKYAHTKRWIKSTEDFIKYAATESSMSGRPYYIECDGIRIPTAQWLSEELARFRNKAQ